LPTPPRAVDVTIVVPLFNEEQNVAPLTARIAEAMGATAHTWEMIIIDDGSRDGTAAALAQAARQYPELKPLYLRRNYGQTTAMQAGFDAASGAFIVTLDGDLQNDPADIPLMLAKQAETDADIVSGWRKQRQDHAITSNLPSRLANALIAKLMRMELHDLGCSLKVYKRDLIDELRIYGELHRFIPAVAMQYGARVVEQEVSHHKRQFGTSKYGLDKTIRVALDIIQLYFFQKFIQRPLHFFGYVGLIALVPGLCMLGWLFMLKVLGFDIGDRPMLITGFMLVLLAVQLLGMGVLGEMLMRIYHEPQGRKQYLLRDGPHVKAARAKAPVR
jgi:glycosyltransferase involved in cell wall biosynthesis